MSAAHFVHTFKVVKEPFGWAVRVGQGMSAPYWSRELAVCEAERLCDALRRHGEAAEVMIEANELGEVSGRPGHFAAHGLRPFWKRRTAHRP